MLDRFAAAKEAEIAHLRFLAEKDALPEPWPGDRPCFAASLRARSRCAVIAEYKRASPSHGEIRLAADPETVAASYTKGGAAALSVLTEESCFRGHVDFLARARAASPLPLLRKDFILDPLQIVQTRATPASAVLLIARMLGDATLHALLRECARQGLEAVTEVFDERDLDRAMAAGAGILQVNNRDLDTLRVDLDVSRRLIRARPSAGSPAGEEQRAGWISASGISRPEELREMADLGFDAVLVGAFLMRGEDPGARLREMLRTAEAF